MQNQTGNNKADIAAQVIDYAGPDRVVSSMEFAEEVRKTPKPKVVLNSGVKSLDDALAGFVPGELIVVSGPTSMGKTTLCDTIIRRMKTDHHLSLFFTFENTAETVALAHDSAESVLFLPRQHVPMDLEWIRWRVIEAKMKYQCEAVFIDHLHYLIPMDGTQNMSLLIGATMRFLKKEIALGLNMAVFIVCHVGKLEMEKEPSIYNLRDSSFVGQEADTVLMVWRRWDLDIDGKKLDSRLQGLSTIKIEKARRTGVMGQKIKVKKEGHLIVESLDEPDTAKREAPPSGRRDDWWQK